MGRMISALACVVFGLAVGSCGNNDAGRAHPLNIGIISIIEHPFLEQARQGFIETMSKHGYVEGKNVKYDYRNAFGKMENANAIASAFVGNKVGLIYSIATPTTQAVKERTSTIPIVFAAVTDPIGAGLVASLEKPGGNITGMTDKIPVIYQMEIIKGVLPNARRIGIPYNAGEANSMSLVTEMRRIAPQVGLSLVETTASTTADVSQAISFLIGKVDAVYMPTDNTMAAAVNVISDICMKNKIPFFSSENETIKKDGALVSLSVDHYKLGVGAAEMAIRVLKDKVSPGEIPVGSLLEYDLTLNLRVAALLGISVPADIRAKARLIQ